MITVLLLSKAFQRKRVRLPGNCIVAQPVLAKLLNTCLPQTQFASNPHSVVHSLDILPNVILEAMLSVCLCGTVVCNYFFVSFWCALHLRCHLQRYCLSSSMCPPVTFRLDAVVPKINGGVFKNDIVVGINFSIPLRLDSVAVIMTQGTGSTTVLETSVLGGEASPAVLSFELWDFWTAKMWAVTFDKLSGWRFSILAQAAASHDGFCLSF